MMFAFMWRAGAGLLVLAGATSACSLLLDNDYTGGDPLPPPSLPESPPSLDGEGPEAGGDAVEELAPDAGKHGRAFVAVGKEGLHAVSTDDGLTWRVLGASDTNSLNSVAFGVGRFVAIGTLWSNAFRVSVTDDLEGWRWTNTHISETGGPRAVTFGADRFVVVASTRSAFSTDGAAWFSYESDFKFRDVTYGAGKFVAVGARGGEGGVAVSVDGAEWAPTQVGGDELTAIAYGNDRFVAVGAGGRKGTSPDGVSWTFNPESSTQEFTSLAYGHGLFVTNDGRTSSDGLKWTAPVLGCTLIAHGGDVFIAADYKGTLYRSTNGTAWGEPVGTIPGIAAVGYGEW